MKIFTLNKCNISLINFILRKIVIFSTVNGKNFLKFACFLITTQFIHCYVSINMTRITALNKTQKTPNNWCKLFDIFWTRLKLYVIVLE